MKLSIIIPYYNAEPYTSELLKVLSPQMRDDVEVIVVDDGSIEPFETDYEWVRVIHKENGGCASARNDGLDVAKGEYISFIDADDLVSPDFIETVLEKTKDEPDVIDLSWKSLDSQGAQHDHLLRSDGDFLKNPSVCTRIFKQSFIGQTRFNELKDSTEDEDFSRKVGYLDKKGDFKHAAICKYMYFYRTSVPNSKIKRFKLGLMHTKRIVYYIPHVAADDLDLLERIKKDDEQNEVWLLTNQCNLPDVKRYCQVSKPFRIWAHEKKGDPCSLIEIIKKPIQAQVVVYCEFAAKVGGITTFIKHFCTLMKYNYDIIFVYEKIDIFQLREIAKIVRCIELRPELTIVCDTLILNRLTDKIKPNIICKKTVQIIHCCRQQSLRIPQDRDLYINVSNAAKKSWRNECKDALVIHNPYINKSGRLFLISVTRVGAPDKGDNDNRMRILGKMLNDKGLPFIWLNFSDGKLSDPPENFYNMPAVPDVTRFIKAADYLVQLSDEEAFSYAVVEALENNVPVLATPFESLFEQGFEDGKTGYIIPYDMNFYVEKICNVPRFHRLQKARNKTIQDQWKNILGDSKPTPGFYELKVISVTCIREYFDIELGRIIREGESVMMTKDRAEYVMTNYGYIKIDGG